MSVLSLCLILFLILAAAVLLFPVVFRADFRLDESGFVADLSVFKKRLWNYTKHWKDEEDADEFAAPVKEEPQATEMTASKTEELPAVKIEESPVAKDEAKPAEPEPQTPNPTSHTQDSTPQTPHSEPAAEPEPESEPEQEEKKSLTEREFWTLVLTPDIDERGYRYGKKILNRFINLFRVRFRDCYVEGIRMDYESMGYGAAVNAMMKGYPFLKDWDLRMDWTRDHDLQSAGHVEASVNLCRTFWFLTVSSVYGGIFAFVFWRRRAAVLKTGALPELGYVRKKILNWIVEE